MISHLEVKSLILIEGHISLWFCILCTEKPSKLKKAICSFIFHFFSKCSNFFFLLFLKFFSQVHSVEKKALEPFWNFSWPYAHSKLQKRVPSPNFSTSWTWKITFSQQQKMFSLPKEKNKQTKYSFSIHFFKILFLVLFWKLDIYLLIFKVECNTQHFGNPNFA